MAFGQKEFKTVSNNQQVVEAIAKDLKTQGLVKDEHIEFLRKYPLFCHEIVGAMQGVRERDLDPPIMALFIRNPPWALVLALNIAELAVAGLLKENKACLIKLSQLDPEWAPKFAGGICRLLKNRIYTKDNRQLLIQYIKHVEGLSRGMVELNTKNILNESNKALLAQHAECAELFSRDICYLHKNGLLDELKAGLIQYDYAPTVAAAMRKLHWYALNNQYPELFEEYKDYLISHPQYALGLASVICLLHETGRDLGEPWFLAANKNLLIQYAPYAEDLANIMDKLYSKLRKAAFNTLIECSESLKEISKKIVEEGRRFWVDQQSEFDAFIKDIVNRGHDKKSPNSSALFYHPPLADKEASETVVPRLVAAVGTKG